MKDAHLQYSRDIRCAVASSLPFVVQQASWMSKVSFVLLQVVVVTCCVSNIRGASNIYSANGPSATLPTSLVNVQTGSSPASLESSAKHLTPAEVVAIELVKVVGQSDSKTRRAAAIRMLETGSIESTKAIMTVFGTPNNDAAKLALCEAIAAVRPQTREFVQPLQNLLNHSDSLVRTAAVAALDGYTDPEVVARLASFRREQQWTHTQEHLKKLMEEVYEETGDEAKRVSRLREWLRSELGLERSKALEILHDDLRRKGAKPTSEILEVVRSMTGDVDELVRQKLVIVLRDVGLLEDVPLIREMLQREQSPIVREEVFKALGKLADPDSINVCIQGLRDPFENVAASAADALGRLCEKGKGKVADKLDMVVSAILERVKHPIRTTQFRIDLLEAMADIADSLFSSVLVENAQAVDADPAIRQAAIRGLGRIQDRTNLGVITSKLLGDSNAAVREVAAEAVGELGDQPAHIEVLQSRLNPRMENAVAVQNRAWEAYQKVFLRLKPADQEAALASWDGNDTKDLARRIDLLIGLETQLNAGNSDPRRLVLVRDQLGDAQLLANQPEEAVAAWSRALLAMPADDTEERTRIGAKMTEACLKSSIPDAALGLVAKTRFEDLRQVIAERFLAYARELAVSDPAATLSLLDKLNDRVPDRFGASYASKFDAIRTNVLSTIVKKPTTTQAATKPVPARNH